MTKYLDLIFAAILCIAGAYLTHESYARIKQLQKPQEALFSEYLTLGESKFHLLQGNSCVGSFNLKIDKDKIFFLQIYGVLRVKAEELQRDFVLQVRSQFNPLGQLIESLSTLTSEDVSATFETKDVNPISISTHGNVLGKEFSWATTLRGPLILREYSKNELGIEYISPIKLEQPAIAGPLAYFKKQLAITVIKESDPNICAADRRTRYNIMPVVNQLRPFMQNDNPFSFILNRLEPNE